MACIWNTLNQTVLFLSLLVTARPIAWKFVARLTSNDGSQSQWTDNNECPEFCPVRLSLAYTFLASKMGSIPIEVNLATILMIAFLATPRPIKSYIDHTLLKLPATHSKTGLHVTCQTADLVATFWEWVNCFHCTQCSSQRPRVRQALPCSRCFFHMRRRSTRTPSIL